MVASFKPCSWRLHVTEALSHPGGQRGWWGQEESRLGPAKYLEGSEGDRDILCTSLVPFRSWGAFRHGVTQSSQPAIGQMAQAVLFLFYSCENWGSKRVFDPKEWVRVETSFFWLSVCFFFFFLILVEPSGSVDLLKTLGLCLFGKPFYSTVYGYWPEVF